MNTYFFGGPITKTVKALIIVNIGVFLLQTASRLVGPIEPLAEVDVTAVRQTIRDHKARTGEGQYVECAQLSSSVFVTSHWYRVDGERRRDGAARRDERIRTAPDELGVGCRIATGEAARAVEARPPLLVVDTEEGSAVVRVELVRFHARQIVFHKTRHDAVSP